MSFFSKIMKCLTRNSNYLVSLLFNVLCRADTRLRGIFGNQTSDLSSNAPANLVTAWTGTVAMDNAELFRLVFEAIRRRFFHQDLFSLQA